MKNTYKMTILYDNGKTFVANGVYKHSFMKNGKGKQEFWYSFYNKTSKAHVDVKIPARDIAALTVKKPNEIVVTKIKPCARITGKAEKKENNNKPAKKATPVVATV